MGLPTQLFLLAAVAAGVVQGLALWPHNEERDSLRRALDVVHHRKTVATDHRVARKLERLLQELDRHLEEEEQEENEEEEEGEEQRRKRRLYSRGDQDYSRQSSFRHKPYFISPALNMGKRSSHQRKPQLQFDKRPSFSRSTTKRTPGRRPLAAPFGNEWMATPFSGSYIDVPRKREAPTIKKKREDGANSQKIMGELNEILKDDDSAKAKKHLKKRQNDEEVPEDVGSSSSSSTNTTKHVDSKRYVENSQMDDEGSEVNIHGVTEDEEDTKPTSFTTSNSDTTTKEKHVPEWLKEEYYRTMAATFSTLKRKKKRSSGAWDVDVPLREEDNGLFSRDFSDGSRHQEVGGRFSQVLGKLNAIEDAMVSDALDLIQQGAWEAPSSSGERDKVLNKLAAAYDIDKIRESLEHLEATMDRMEDLDYPQVEEKRGNPESHNMAEALSLMATKRNKGEDSGDNELNNDIPMSSEFSDFPSSDLELPEKFNNGEDCPALDLLTSDCAVLGDLIPGGRIRDVILRACNLHELCYTCGEAYGLSSDECDVGFVEQSRTICRDDEPCQSTARLMLVPLRQRRFFYKRSVPDLCYRQPCVEEFLRQFA